jgi:hypothetical protein
MPITDKLQLVAIRPVSQSIGLTCRNPRVGSLGGVKNRFAPNIGRTGRLIRGGIGVVLLGMAIPAFRLHWLAAIAAVAGGLFCLFEAQRGWCVARACGLKTRW